MFNPDNRMQSELEKEKLAQQKLSNKYYAQKKSNWELYNLKSYFGSLAFWAMLAIIAISYATGTNFFLSLLYGVLSFVGLHISDLNATLHRDSENEAFLPNLFDLIILSTIIFALVSVILLITGATWLPLSGALLTLSYAQQAFAVGGITAGVTLLSPIWVYACARAFQMMYELTAANVKFEDGRRYGGKLTKEITPNKFHTLMTVVSYLAVINSIIVTAIYGPYLAAGAGVAAATGVGVGAGTAAGAGATAGASTAGTAWASTAAAGFVSALPYIAIGLGVTVALFLVYKRMSAQKGSSTKSRSGRGRRGEREFGRGRGNQNEDDLDRNLDPTGLTSRQLDIVKQLMKDKTVKYIRKHINYPPYIRTAIYKQVTWFNPTESHGVEQLLSMLAQPYTLNECREEWQNFSSNRTNQPLSDFLTASAMLDELDATANANANANANAENNNNYTHGDNQARVDYNTKEDYTPQSKMAKAAQTLLDKYPEMAVSQIRQTLTLRGGKIDDEADALLKEALNDSTRLTVNMLPIMLK